MEVAYNAEHDTYSNDKSLIGFSTVGTTKYGYVITNASATIFDATATAIWSANSKTDVWTIDQALDLDNGTNACAP